MGAFVCGFWLIGILGVWGTLVFAVAINVAIGACCIRASGKMKMPPLPQAGGAGGGQINSGDETATETPVETGGQGRYRGEITVALVIFAVSGFCSMAYEVIWTKLLGLIVGPTTYSFTIVLVTFILGLALGSILFGWLGDRTKKPVELLLFTQVAAALFVLGISQLLGNSQLFFAKLLFTFKDNFALLSIAKAAVLFIFMILPTLCLGATFPLVGKIYTRSMAKLGRSIGSAYAINTIGAVAGSFCAGFILVPVLGKENGLSLVAALQLSTAVVAGVIIFRASLKNIVKLSTLAIPALAGVVLCFYFPVWNHVVLSQGKYHRFKDLNIDIKHRGWLDALLNGSEILTRSERGELVFYGEGVGGFTTVMKYSDPLGHINYIMANSGKADASSRGDMGTQTLSAHLPMLFHKDAKSVMVLGLASGITAGEILYYPVERLDVIDINRQVVAGSDFFIPWNNNVLSNERTNLIIQDGRAHLQLSETKYDVIISEPSNPWMAGLATLFTQNFFELARESLNDDGIFVQFIHSYQMDWPSFSMVGRTFAKVFGNSLLISTIPGRIGPDYLLVGFKGKDGLVLENARKNLSYIQDAQNVDIVDARLLYRLIVAEDLEKLFGPGPVNTDIEPHLEFAAPKLLYHRKSAIVENIKAQQWLSPETTAIVDELKANIDSRIDFAEYALSIYSPFKNMVDLIGAESSQKQRFFSLMQAYCATNPVDYAIFGNDQLKENCASLQIKTIEDSIDKMPDRASSYSYLGILYNMMDMPDQAEKAYNKSLEIKPGVWNVHLSMAAMFNRHKQFDRAIAQYNKALQINSGLVEAHVNIAMLLTQQGQLHQAANRFLAALRIDPEFANAYNGLGLCFFQQGRPEEAVKWYSKALQIAPDMAGAHTNIAIALSHLGKLDDAAEHFIKSIEIGPETAEDHNNLGVILARQSKFGRAVEHFRKAMQIEPDYEDARKNLSRVLIERGQTLTDKKTSQIIHFFACSYVAGVFYYRRNKEASHPRYLQQQLFGQSCVALTPYPFPCSQNATSGVNLLYKTT